MKKKYLKILLIGLIFVLSATLSFATEIPDFEIRESANITDMLGETKDINEERTVINGDSFESDEEISIDYDVDGNLYVLTKQLDIKSCHVDGNAFILAENININNFDVTGTLYILGSNINIQGNFKDIYALGENITFSENSNILKNFNALGKNVTISGNIGRDCFIKSSTINVENNSQIKGKLNAEVEEEQIGTDAIINEKNIKHIEKVDDKTLEETNKVFNGFSLFSSVFKAVIIIGILTLKDKFSKKSEDNITVKSAFGTAFSGIGALILIPIISLILICTVAGAGVGIVLLILYFIFIYISTSVASYEISKKFINKFNINVNTFVKYLISVLLYTIVKLISVYTNILVFSIILGIYGMGYIWKYVFKRNKKVISEADEIEKRIDEIE